MKKVFLFCLFAALSVSIFAQIPQYTKWNQIRLQVVNHARGAGVLDTLTAIKMDLATPNYEVYTSAAADSADKILQTFTLPKPTKTCDFNFLCSNYSYQSDSTFVVDIGKVTFTSGSSARKIYSTAVTGAGKTYAVFSASKSFTDVSPGEIVRLHYIATSTTTGTWYISSPVSIR